MIAANHPSLGMNPHQSGETNTPIIGPGYRSFPVPPPTPVITHVQPAAVPPVVNQISPVPVTDTSSLARVRTVEIETPIEAPTVPASAAATPPSVSADTSATLDSFLNWLTEETVYSGVPNGAILAGGVIGAAWLFGGKKGRR
jgi:hypothetical protein